MSQHTDPDVHSQPAHGEAGQTGRATPAQAPLQPPPPVGRQERGGLAGRRLLLA
jgi:hypothetical protein